MSTCESPTNRFNSLEDDALDDALHDWIVCCTGLEPSLVRPAWQPDPPPAPPFTTPCWCAFYVLRTSTDWDSVGLHNPPNLPPGDYVSANQTLHLGLTFYGRIAGLVCTTFNMATGVDANLQALVDAGIKLQAVNDATNVSELIKGRWQRRIDLDVELKRMLNYSFAPVNDMVGLCGSIVADGVPGSWDWCLDKDSSVIHKGDCAVVSYDADSRRLQPRGAIRRAGR